MIAPFLAIFPTLAKRGSRERQPISQCTRARHGVSFGNISIFIIYYKLIMHTHIRIFYRSIIRVLQK